MMFQANRKNEDEVEQVYSEKSYFPRNVTGSRRGKGMVFDRISRIKSVC